MDAIEFLRWVVPQGNNYSVFRSIDKTSSKTYWPTRNWTDQSKLANFLQGVSRSHSRDTYFALASFIVAGKPGIKDPAKIVPARLQSNVAALRSLWVDIDCKSDDSGYLSKHEALAALSSAIDEDICPQPSIIVDSGNGVHVYWCFTDDIHPLDWAPVANGFRDTLVSAGVKIDAGITIDSARILRLPGTMNFKDPTDPKPVKILARFSQLDWSDVEHFSEAQAPTLKGYHSALGGSNLIEATDADFDLGVIGTTEPFHMEYATVECGQLRQMFQTGGAGVSEPLWKAALLVAARCEDGPKYAHLLSKGHVDYDPAATDAKFQQQVATLASGRAGPTRCTTFGAARPEICAVCPHAGAVSSPLLLGRESTGLPPGYIAKLDGIYHRTKEPDDDEWTWEKTCSTLFDKLQMYSDVTHGNMMAGESRVGQTVRQFHLSHADLSVPPTRAIATVNKAGWLVRPQEMKNVQGLMMDWATYLGTRRSAVPPARTIGWNTQRTTFNYRERIFSSKGESRGIFIDEEALGAYDAMGSREAWFIAERHMLAAPIELQALVLLSFAAPLIAFTGMDGFVFSFRSTNTGLGKSTALRMGAAVWGDPMRTHFSMNDTQKSVLRKIGLTPNLPAYWDEVRIVGDGRAYEALTKTIFEVAQGREMARLRADTSFNTAGQWKTLLGVCTNESLTDVAAGAASGPGPVLARLMEIDVPEAGLQPHGDAAKALTALTTNYGHIGPEYLLHVTRQTKPIAEALTNVANDFEKRMGGSGVQRYWQVAAAAMVVAAYLTSKAGLFRVDPEAIRDLMLRTMSKQADVHVDTVAQIGDHLQTFRDWFLSTQDSWLVTKGAPVRAGNPGPVQVLSDPRNKMLFHADVDTGKVRVKSSTVSDWCRSRHVPPIIFRRGLEPMVTSVLATIGAGTAFSSPRCPCFEFDMDAVGVREAVERQCDRANFNRPAL